MNSYEDRARNPAVRPTAEIFRAPDWPVSRMVLRHTADGGTVVAEGDAMFGIESASDDPAYDGLLTLDAPESVRVHCLREDGAVVRGGDPIARLTFGA